MDKPIEIGDFGAQADVYAASRPDYPDALLDRLLSRAGVAAGDHVADLGAGTGIAARWLANRGLNVTAIEPNASMRGRASPHERIVWMDGTFEETGLGDSSCAWALAAQAFHWATPAPALAELRRVLRPGAAFTALWNNSDNDSCEVLSFTRAAIARIVPEFDYAYRDTRWDEVLTSTDDFDDVVYDDEYHVVSMSRTRYLDLWRSHNRLNAIAGPILFARLLEEVSAFLDERDIETVDVGYLTKSWTVRASVG
jgi:SAM-dependent methyltransferase